MPVRVRLPAPSPFGETFPWYAISCYNGCINEVPGEMDVHWLYSLLLNRTATPFPSWYGRHLVWRPACFVNSRLRVRFLSSAPSAHEISHAPPRAVAQGRIRCTVRRRLSRAIRSVPIGCSPVACTSGSARHPLNVHLSCRSGRQIRKFSARDGIVQGRDWVGTRWPIHDGCIEPIVRRIRSDWRRAGRQGRQVAVVGLHA